jgi:hypothetical protein
MVVSGRRTILAPYVARAREFAARIIEPAKGAAATADLLEISSSAGGESADRRQKSGEIYALVT